MRLFASRNRLELHASDDLAGDEISQVANARARVVFERRRNSGAEQAELREHRDANRAERARLAVEHLDGDAKRWVRDADCLEPFRAALAHEAVREVARNVVVEAAFAGHE